MASLSLKNVCKVYPNGFVAVKDFNLDVADKEFIIFVGPSGCGKSTTLRMIAGLEEISSGELWIGDKLVNDVEPKDRDIAMVFQNYALYPHMTVYDNMSFGLKLRKVPKPEIDKLVHEAAKILGIEQLLDRKPKALSGGQRQRVAMGRAIVRSPKVFLMDEPLSNLDAKLRNQMRSEMIQLHNKLGCTFIYVTHDQTEAMTMGTDIVVIYKGKVMQHGTPEEIYNKPANLFVAQFIGDPGMNALSLSGGGYVGFKPRSAGFERVENGLELEGKILTCEFMGYELMYTIDLGMGNVIVRSTQKKKMGEQVRVFIAKEELYYFDEQQNSTQEVQSGEVVKVFHVDG